MDVNPQQRRRRRCEIMQMPIAPAVFWRGSTLLRITCGLSSMETMAAISTR